MIFFLRNHFQYEVAIIYFQNIFVKEIIIHEHDPDCNIKNHEHDPEFKTKKIP